MSEIKAVLQVPIPVYAIEVLLKIRYNGFQMALEFVQFLIYERIFTTNSTFTKSG